MNIFLKVYDKKVLSVHALIVFKIFCFVFDVKIKLKVLASSCEITYTSKPVRLGVIMFFSNFIRAFVEK
jgi:hypothetical protein